VSAAAGAALAQAAALLRAADGLLIGAGAGFGDDRVVEYHGSIHHLQCTRPFGTAIWAADRVDPVVDPAPCLMSAPLPRCPHCGQLARPNILVFGDGRWLDARTDDQYARLDRWRAGGRNLVVVELGAGTDVPSVRRVCEAQDALVALKKLLD
jgi:NAD-dependent SIR2 family protein deacetylase